VLDGKLATRATWTPGLGTHLLSAVASGPGASVATTKTPAVDAGLVPHRLAPRQEGVTSGLVGRHWSGVSTDQARHLSADPPDPSLAKARLALQMGLQGPASQDRLGLLPALCLDGRLDLDPGLVRETGLSRGDPRTLMG
jgi:hypothetical protein